MIDLRPVNAATVPCTWPLDRIDSEVMDLSGSNVFASIDCCSGYWQLPMDPDSQLLHAFMAQNSFVQPTRTLQDDKNAVAKFQSKVEPCFREMRDLMKARLDEVCLNQKDEAGLLEVLEIFMEICREKGQKNICTQVGIVRTVPSMVRPNHRLQWSEIRPKTNVMSPRNTSTKNGC